MPARLTICPPESAARIVLLEDDGQHALGRDPDIEVCIDHPSISRIHAFIEAGGNGWSITDQSSKNGCFINGEPVDNSALRDGDWIRLGDVLCEFEQLTRAQAEAAEARGRQRITNTLRLQRRLTPSQSVGELIEQTLDGVLSLAQLQRGFLLLRQGQEWVVRSHRGIELDQLCEIAFTGSATAVDRCLDTAAPVVVNEIQPGDWLGDRSSIVSAGIRALVCLPLAVEQDLLGIVYADSREVVRPLAVLDLEILESLAIHAALTIAMARMREQLKQVEQQMRPPIPASEAAAAGKPTWSELKVRASGE